MKISAHVDYMAITWLDTVPDIVALFGGKAELYGISTREARPLQGYERATYLLSGALLLNGPDRMGTHCICSGDTLSRCRDAGQTDRAIALQVIHQKAKTTRVDVTFDFVGCRMSPQTVKRAWKAGQIHTRARRARQWEQLDEPGHTVYIGSPQSDRIARFYDKNADLGIKSKERWTRMELQNRKRWARATAAALADAQEVITVAAGAFENFMQWEHPEYRAALARDKSDIEPEQPRPHDTLAWLIDQVAPAFARYEFEHPTINTMAIFLQSLADERLALQNGRDRPF